MDIFKLLDEFEEVIESSKKIPIYGKVMISDGVLLDYLDRIRTALPEEIQQAKWLTQERERMVTEARLESERIMTTAREETGRMTSQSELTRQAQAVSEEIINQAKHVAREIKSGATAYADEILGELEGRLDQNLASIRQAREELNQMK